MSISSSSFKNNILKISHKNTYYFLRYAHGRYVKSLFTNIQKQWNMLKISLLFKEFTNFTGKYLENQLGLRMRNFQGIAFLWTQTYTEIFKSTLVYLWYSLSHIVKCSFSNKASSSPESLTSFNKIIFAMVALSC